jgi:hypothetical protein
MRNLIAALLIAAGGWAGVASAQTPIDHPQLIEDTGPDRPGLMTCYYNEQGGYTGSDQAQQGATEGGPTHVSPGAAQAWGYNIAAPDGRSCPQSLPR